MLFKILTLALLATSNATVKGEEPLEQIRILPVARTPEANTVTLSIAIPKNGQLFSKTPVWVQFRIDGFALGAGSSQFERSKEIANSKMGQTVRVVVDDHPYFAVNEPAVDPFDESGYYYNTSYKFEIPYKLKSGMHTLQVFPARSYGESLKGDRTYQAITFYVGDKETNPEINLNAPYLTYNEPSSQMAYREGAPILLDFYISNCELTQDGYKVRLTIDGKVKRTLSSWQPYYIYGLSRGEHSIRLQLIDEKGKQVQGVFNDVQRSIKVM